MYLFIYVFLSGTLHFFPTFIYFSISFMLLCISIHMRGYHSINESVPWGQLFVYWLINIPVHRSITHALLPHTNGARLTTETATSCQDRLMGFFLSRASFSWQCWASHPGKAEIRISITTWQSNCSFKQSNNKTPPGPPLNGLQ